MPRHVDDFDEDDDWEGDHEAGTDDDDDEEAETVPCPYCRRLIYEDAERCPYCESYISAVDAPAGRKPLWIIVGTLAVLAILYMWIVP